MNSNSTSKFLFYHFNTFRQVQGKSFLEIRHSVIAHDDYALENLQNKNWQYFVETLLFVARNQLSEFQESEKDILKNSFDNLNYCKDYYQAGFDDTAYFFYQYIKKIHDIFVEKMEDNISHEIYFHKPLKSIENPKKLLKLFSQFFLKMGRFPGSGNLAIVLMGVIPSFVKTKELISPFDLYEKFNSTSTRGLVSTQFLAAFDIFIGGNKTITKNAMSGFFHNLSMQALSRGDDRINIKFDVMEELNKSIKKLLKDEVDRNSDISFIDFIPEQFEEIKDPNQSFEENVVENIMSSNRIDYLQDADHMSFPNTEQEILVQCKANYELEEKLARAVNESKEIPLGTVTVARKEPFNSLLNVDGQIGADVVQDLSDVGISNTRTEYKNAKRDFVEHLKSFIKKDNADYLLTIKTADNSSNEPATTSFSMEFPTLTEILRSPPGKFTIRRSKRLAEKNPHQK